ncbi:penicillin-binding protein activator [Vibrio sp. Of7-15]|uniref:penicillin-binding protein activator n=1 Tax=Vibrio sp. Of7-15 TaxID=2724879 RepID=UPI001EF2AC97|nr:penicillin-binding protein activator [Vibrio sp. Of7-15]MCG7498189.1 penicillin-binding protein activator [Vibrio sp. Of7-15]
MAKITHKRKSVTRLLAPVALAIGLAACSGTPNQQLSADITAPATASSADYILQAENQEGALKNDWLILALKASINENNISQADLILRRLANQNLSPVQMAEWQLARAELRHKNQQTGLALQGLNFQPWWKLADAQWQHYHQLRATLFSLANDELNASRELIELAKYSQDPSAQWQQVWQKITVYSQYELQSLKFDEEEDVLRGWSQLAIYIKTLQNRPSNLKKALENWLATNPNHPAATYTPSVITEILALEIVRPDNVALLLPLSGKYAPQGSRVRDGFINAMLSDENRNEATNLKVIDTNSQSMEQITAQLANNHIEFVIGPLTKSNIEKFQAVNHNNLPQLALNIPEQRSSTANACYFALSPEQEAQQAAQHLFANGHQYPLVLAPSGKFGMRVVEAFNQQWKQLTNQAPENHFFGSKSQLQQQVNDVFGLKDSQNRIAQMKQILNIELETQARSRRDIDAVYMIANRSELTLLKPFIEVAINPDANPPKLFASSRSNNGSSKQLSEIKGIEFSDIPLLTDENHSFMVKFETLWPKSSNGQVRLHALGMDAYQLITELPQMKAVESYSTPGKTGVLSINKECVIQRQISWATHGLAKTQQ